MTDYSKQLVFISQCQDPKQLNTLLENARNRSNTAVANAAFRKLISIVPSEEPGTLEHDFWRTINAFEHILSHERGKTTRLSRTRQKVSRVGVVQTLRDWALDRAETDGFRMLMERHMPELTGEAVILRHPDRFDQEVCDAARNRLVEMNVEVSNVTAAQ